MTEEKKEEIKEVKEEEKVEVKKENKVEDKKEEKVEAKKTEETKSETKEVKEEEAVDVPKKFEKLVQEIEKMSVADLAELVKILEKKFGVSAVTSGAVAAPISTSAESFDEPKEEKSVFNIELTAVGDKKIEVIKIVRDATQKGLKEAKDVADAAATSPQTIKENVKKEEAEGLKKQLEAVGAKIELK